MATIAEALQPSLYDSVPPPPPRKKWLSPEERFRRFHAAHPYIYDAIVAEARRVKRAGQRRGIRAIFEYLRYEHTLRMHGEEWKLNNTYASFYAREIEAREPDLKGFFEFRGRHR